MNTYYYTTEHNANGFIHRGGKIHCAKAENIEQLERNLSIFQNLSLQNHSLVKCNSNNYLNFSSMEEAVLYDFSPLHQEDFVFNTNSDITCTVHIITPIYCLLDDNWQS